MSFADSTNENVVQAKILDQGSSSMRGSFLTHLFTQPPPEKSPLATRHCLPLPHPVNRQLVAHTVMCAPVMLWQNRTVENQNHLLLKLRKYWTFLHTTKLFLYNTESFWTISKTSPKGL